MRNNVVVFVGALTMAGLVLAVPDAHSASAARAEAHAYFLFLAQPPKGCEDCYVPLLVTVTRLEELAKEKRDEQGILITTYERDSIVGAPRGVAVSAAEVRVQERTVRVLGRLYRYQEISASEALSLLDRPGGTIPISRIPEMRVPSADELADLIARFRVVKE